MNYLVVRKSGEAVYSQIYRALRREVREHYKPGDCLPTEPQLAELFSVNRHTIRRAVDVLLADGLVQRQHGRGTFVTAYPIEYPITKGTRFTENLASSGKAIESTILRKLVVPARGGVAKNLEITSETSVIWMETLRLVEDLPFCIISHFLPHKGFEFVLEKFEGGSLHRFLNQMGISPVRRQSLITAQIPVAEDAKYLQMPANQPVLRVKSVNVNAENGQSVEYAVTRFRADRVQLNIALG